MFQVPRVNSLWPSDAYVLVISVSIDSGTGLSPVWQAINSTNADFFSSWCSGAHFSET